jgi:hypothetical protein
MILIIKSVLVGLLGAVGLLLVVVMALVLPSLWRLRGSGSGGIGAVSYNLFGPLAIAVIGFLLGFVWMYRRG